MRTHGIESRRKKGGIGPGPNKSVGKRGRRRGRSGKEGREERCRGSSGRAWVREVGPCVQCQVALGRPLDPRSARASSFALLSTTNVPRAKRARRKGMGRIERHARVHASHEAAQKAPTSFVAVILGKKRARLGLGAFRSVFKRTADFSRLAASNQTKRKPRTAQRLRG